MPEFYPAKAAAGFKSKARAYLSANQALTAATLTKVNLNTEDFDGLGEFDTTTYKFTAQAAGYYLVIGSVTIDIVDSGLQYLVEVNKNGVAELLSAHTSGLAESQTVVAAGIVYLAAGNYLELYARIGGTTNRNIVSYRDRTFLAVHRIS
jgi:hypothetical protein